LWDFLKLNLGHYDFPPAEANFPIPYSDDFDGYQPPKMARYFSGNKIQGKFQEIKIWLDHMLLMTPILPAELLCDKK
jgi:hypothetical protein